MKIVELTALQVRVALRRPIRHASHTRTSTDNVVVRCVLEDGTQGFGEGVPRDYVTGETIDSVLALLKRSDLRGQLEPCRDFAQAVGVAERLRLAPVPGDDRECQGNAARCALELAVLDAYGRHFREPLSAATRQVTPELYEPKEWIRYSGAITSARGWKMRIAAWRTLVWRFPDVKVKVGMEGYDDARRLKVLREVLGFRRDVRIDANEAWTAGTVAQRLYELRDYQVSSVEQPVPHEQVDRLAEVRRQVSVPIMLDESLCSRVDAERAIECGTCDLFNLRLSKCGGLIPSLRLAELARRHGLGYQLGCQVGETAILSAAGRHFACSVNGWKHAEGSYDRYLVRQPLGRKDITFQWGGWAPALGGGGLGLEVDGAALEGVTIRKEPLLG